MVWKDGLGSVTLMVAFFVPESPSTMRTLEEMETDGLESLSPIVMVVVLGAVRIAGPVGLDKVRLNVSFPPSKKLSLMIGTLMILLNSPGPKVRVPLAAV